MKKILLIIILILFGGFWSATLVNDFKTSYGWMSQEVIEKYLKKDQIIQNYMETLFNENIDIFKEFRKEIYEDEDIASELDKITLLWLVWCDTLEDSELKSCSNEVFNDELSIKMSMLNDIKGYEDETEYQDLINENYSQ